MVTWQRAITGCLIELKRYGVVDFDEAWGIAYREHPPRSRDLGEQSAPLFDVRAGDREPTVVEFTRSVNERAWRGVVGPVGSGDGPALRFFRTELIREDEDSRPARRGHRFRSVA